MKLTTERGETTFILELTERDARGLAAVLGEQNCVTEDKAAESVYWLETEKPDRPDTSPIFDALVLAIEEL